MHCQLIMKSMEKFSFSRVTACAVAFVVLLAATSCVNSKYELSEKNMDLNVTVFQEGVSLPLGSTVAMRLDAILEKAGLKEELEKYFSTDADGAYALSVKSTMDVSEDLADLQDCTVELSEQVDAVDEDLNALEEDFYEEWDDEDECDCCCGCDEDEEYYDVTCPSCGEDFEVDEDTLLDGGIDCPYCNEHLEFDFDCEEDEEEEEQE